jgi:hypothetical protein
MADLYNVSELIVHPSQSKLNAGIAARNNHLAAVCGDCFLILGFKFTGTHSGFWSCLHGCGKRYENKLCSQTSSFMTLTEPYTRRLDEWVTGWLGISEDIVTVRIEGEE